MKRLFNRVILPTVLVVGLAIAIGIATPKAMAQTSITVTPLHMEIDPTGEYTVLWESNSQVYVHVHGNPLPPFPISLLLGRETVQYTDPRNNNPLPILMQFDGQTFLIAWLTNNPPPPKDPYKAYLHEQCINRGIATGVWEDCSKYMQ